MCFSDSVNTLMPRIANLHDNVVKMWGRTFEASVGQLGLLQHHNMHASFASVSR